MESEHRLRSFTKPPRDGSYVRYTAGFETWCVQCRSLFLEVMCWKVSGLIWVGGEGGVWCGRCWQENEYCKRKYLILCAQKLLIIQPNKANTLSGLWSPCWWMFWCYYIVALTVKFVYTQSLPLFSTVTIIVKQEYGAVYLRRHDLLNEPFQDRPF